MPVLYVESDERGAGKTALCVAIATLLSKRGKSAVVLKPVAGERAMAGPDPDPGIYGKLLDQRVARQPLDPGSDRLSAAAVDEIRAEVDQASQSAETVLLEGSNALSAEEAGRLADELDARALVVVRYRRELLGSQLTQWPKVFGQRLLGFVVNGVTRYLESEARDRLLPSMESERLVCLGMIPEDRRLLGVTVAQLAEHLDGRFIVCEENGDGLVEYLMVGGMGMDPGELYFRERDNKAVIVRGDRPDVQMSALTTPTACMVMTEGIEPIEYVKYEAQQEEVPVMVVSTDTLGTMDAVATLMDSARFDHPLKLSRFVEMVERHVDLEALWSGLGLEG